MNAHLGDVTGGCNQALLNGEGTNTRKDIAAVLPAGHFGAVHRHLQEQVVHIAAGVSRRADDRHFAGQWMRTAQAVYLARIGRTHGGEQHPITLSDTVREIGGKEIQTLGRTAP